jgi:hypothetical protein
MHREAAALPKLLGVAELVQKQRRIDASTEPEEDGATKSYGRDAGLAKEPARYPSWQAASAKTEAGKVGIIAHQVVR